MGGRAVGGGGGMRRKEVMKTLILGLRNLVNDVFILPEFPFQV